MARATNWSQLKIGILTGVAVAGVAAAVLVFARIGALHGDTTRLYMVTDQASGVINGTEVWVGGEKVGLVRSVHLRPPSADTTERVAITMDVLTEYLHLITRDSDVRLRPGGSLIGAPVVYITVGTPNKPAVREGDTLHARSAIERRSRIADVSTVADSVASMLREFGKIKNEFGVSVDRAADVRARSEQQISSVERAITSMHDRATRSNGSLALAISDTARLRSEVSRITAVSDSIRTAAVSGAHGIGRFRADSTLILSAKQLLAHADSLRGAIARYAGKATGKDSTMAHQLEHVHVQLDSLVSDAKAHPFKYISL